ncbi:MAG: V-type ATP synthase subunit B [Candidatus Latescibacteria bacterium]|nr:V-type ATP synthase subunit B [Candidatus Latescibacterota bacterium]
MDLITKEYRTINYISGPLLFLEKVRDFPYNAMVEIILPSNEVRNGQVLEIGDKHVLIQILEKTAGMDIEKTRVRLKEEVSRIGVSGEMVGRIFDGMARPIDGLGEIPMDKRLPVIGSPINPVARARPEDFIMTGISAIDGFNTLVRGQKLPIFSGAGLPANEIAAQILEGARVREEDENFVVIFAAMGITRREEAFFVDHFDKTGIKNKVISFMNLADDPTIERILTPRCALTTAEYFAFEKGMHVLVVLTDMTNYCEALREVATAREEIPGRRGYPGYMYSDLASLYERAGRLRGKPGSITMLPILTMPDDDITHPIADLTGYITEGQIVLSRALHRQSIFPPIDVLPSLSRLMNNGIGEGKTRDDHRELSNQLYACYSEGIDIRRLMSIMGEDALSEMDKNYLQFAELFEKKLIGQGAEPRNIMATLDLGWELLKIFPKEELNRINKDLISRYFTEIMEDGIQTPFF